MAGTEKKKVGRLQKRSQERRAERERAGDTPEAVAERSNGAKPEYDPNRLRQLGERSGIFG